MSRRGGWTRTFLVAGGYAAVTAAYLGVILPDAATFVLTMALTLAITFLYRRWLA